MLPSTLAGDLLSIAASQASKNGSSGNGQNKNKGVNFNIIRGHINNIPIDLKVVSGSHSAGSSRNTHGKKPEHGNPVKSVQHNVASAKRAASNTSQNVSQSSGQNFNNSSPSNPNKGKKQQGNVNKKQNSDKNQSCQIKVQGNCEIKIKQTESDFTKITLSNPKPNQNSQKGGCNNTSKQKQQNVNQSSGNQDNQHKRTQNGNQNKVNNQNKPYKSGNQNATVKLQNEGHVKVQYYPVTKGDNEQLKWKEEKAWHPKLHELNLSKNNSGQNTWMYLGRLKVGTSHFEIKNYLQQKFSDYDFTVETLPLYKDAKLPSFKVNVDNRILNEFQDLENWPNGVKIRKFIQNFKVKAN